MSSKKGGCFCRIGEGDVADQNGSMMFMLRRGGVGTANADWQGISSLRGLFAGSLTFKGITQILREACLPTRQKSYFSSLINFLTFAPHVHLQLLTLCHSPPSWSSSLGPHYCSNFPMWISLSTGPKWASPNDQTPARKVLTFGSLNWNGHGKSIFGIQAAADGIG